MDNSIELMKERYQTAKQTKKGQKFLCPACGKELIKTSYQHTFCAGKCKDNYWNTIDPKRALFNQFKL